MAFATILVHDADPGRARRIPGTVGPALEDLGIEPRVASFVSAPDAVPDPADAELVVVMGSAESAADDTLTWLGPETAHLRRAVEIGTPVLGICFGGQALSRVMGGTVGRASRRERGFVDVEVADPRAIPAPRWMQFHDDAFTLPPGAVEVARNDVCLQGFTSGPHLGVQFHPEITVDVFSAWGESFAERSAGGARVDTEARRLAGDDMVLPDRAQIDAIVAEMTERAAVTEQACRDLVRGFCERAGSVRPSAQQPTSRVAR